MPRHLHRIGATCARHPRTVIALWLVVVVAAGFAARAAGSRTGDESVVPGSDSAAATALLERSQPERTKSTSPLLLEAADGRLTEDEVTAVVQAVEDAPHVASASNPLATPGDVSDDGSVAVVRVQADVGSTELTKEMAEEIYAAAEGAAGDGVRVEAGGDIGRRVSREPPHTSEIVGLTTAVIVLLFVLGGAVAMAMPIVTALVAVVLGLSVITLLTHTMTVPDVAPTLGTMIGLGVGIDYALFLISRHRELRRGGRDAADAAGAAIATSGSAVLFAGATVVIALASLAVADIAPVTGLGVSAAAMVAVAVLVALTLLPALLGLAGDRIDALAVRRDPAAVQARSEHRWRRWAELVVRRRLLAAGAAAVVLLVLAIPALSLELGQVDVGAKPPSTTERQAYDLNARAFGPGANGTILVAVETPSGTEARELETLRSEIAATPGVASVSPPDAAGDGRSAVLSVQADTAPSDEATAELVTELRDDVLPAATEGTGMTASVGGQTAAQIDLAAQIAAKLPLIIAVVVGLSFVLLLVAFRSVLVPVKAAAMNLVSVAAAYGVLVAVFQWGWGAELIGLDGPMAIVSYVPMVMFAVLFGLSMDYEVFLLSRVYEAYRESGDNNAATVRGLALTGRIITAAALIMVSVFASFVLDGDPLVKMFGVGLAAAIAIDATIVRCLLVPAVMAMLGRPSWWCPRWLLRILPPVDIEGAGWERGRTELT